MYHAISAIASGSETTSRCAADRKMTGNAVAYLSALYSGRLESLVGELYSMRHWRKRTAYGKLDQDDEVELSIDMGVHLPHECR